MEKKKEPSIKLPQRSELKKARRIEITGYLLDQNFEPWNEYVLQGDPPILIKTRTILAKLEWYPDYTNTLGDPFIWANHNTTMSASRVKTAEAGLT